MDNRAKELLWEEFDWLMTCDQIAPWELSSMAMRLAHDSTVDVMLGRLTDPQLVLLLREFPPDSSVDPDEVIVSNPTASRLCPPGHAYQLLWSRLRDIAVARPELASAAAASPPVSQEVRAVRMCEDEGMSPAAVAQTFQVSEARVRRWLLRAERKRQRQRS